MHLDIDGSSLVRRPAIRRHVEAVIARWLGPFAQRIGKVRLRLRERPPSEATRTLCGIAVTLDVDSRIGRGWVLARAEHDDPCLAVDRAVERVAQSVSEAIAQRDRKQALLARALLPGSRSGVMERA